ncbi:MAG: bifunctional folylpolyglutamate synthase/dihydrofolate synthase [Pyrinomonadaceae bacterium]
MNFRESQSYLFSLGNEVSAMKLGLESMHELLAALGKPQQNYIKVQVAGTNGKGSVCAFLGSMCVAAHVKVGVTTSPHLVSVTERVLINGEPIDEDEFAEFSTRVREASEALVRDGRLETVPTYFEQVTAIALLAFAAHKVELAILETGLGGRLDATTAANAEIAAITRIDLDHQEYLGETLREIAGEKAAIIHRDSRVVVGEQQPEAMAVILERCRSLGVEPRLASDTTATFDGETVTFRDADLVLSNLRLGLAGDHQIENAKIAIGLAREMNIEAKHISQGLASARHPGRLEWMTTSDGEFLLDGAHNIGGAAALRDYILKYRPEPRMTLVFGCMRDKDVRKIAALLFPLADEIILTEASNSRSMQADDLYRIAAGIVPADDCTAVKRLADAIDLAVRYYLGRPDASHRFICVTGSLYLVGEAKKLLRKRSAT